MTNKNKKTSIQVSNDIHESLKKLCEENGYKLSGFVEKLIKTAVTGSIISNKKSSQQLLNG